MNLTDEEIRIKVVEALKWTPTPEGRWTKDQAGLAPPYFDTCQLPNYLADLNACAEFETALTDKEHLRYRVNLWNVVIGDGDETTWDRQFISATARQRCLAYLKTKGILP